MESIEQKTAVVTGGGSGIGLAMAKRFAKGGARVVLADVDAGALAAAEKELASLGAEVLGVQTDVSQRASVDALRDAAIARFGRVHILCNNAGVQVAGPMWKISPAKWEWIMGVNLWGVIHGVQSFVPHMIEHGEAGQVVNTASAAGLLTVPSMSAYCVTKHGVVALTECLSGDLKQANAAIRASVLCPAFVRTNLHLSSRNLPVDAPDAQGTEALMSAEEEAAFDASVKSLVESGIAADAVAEAVYQNLLTPKLHILTHPEVLPFVQQRAERIAASDPGK